MFLKRHTSRSSKFKVKEELNTIKWVANATVNDESNHVPLGILGADLGESNQLENAVWHKVRGARKKRFHCNEKICSPKD